MSKKMRLTWHDIDLYLEEKISKDILELKKEHFIRDLEELKRDYDRYHKLDNKVLADIEWKIYQEKLDKNKTILNALKLIFPNDYNLTELIEDMKD